MTYSRTKGYLSTTQKKSTRLLLSPTDPCHCAPVSRRVCLFRGCWPYYYNSI